MYASRPTTEVLIEYSPGKFFKTTREALEQKNSAGFYKGKSIRGRGRVAQLKKQKNEASGMCK
jgi:hypothetical protein